MTFKAGKRMKERKDREDGEKAAILLLKRARVWFWFGFFLVVGGGGSCLLAGFVWFCFVYSRYKESFLSTQLALSPNASWWTRHICPSSV